MKIGVALSETDLTIMPGSTAQLVVTMTNRQETADRLSFEIEGLDVEWYAIPVPAVNVAPGAQVSERVLFKVARSSENRAGSYPFLVRVQAMESGEVGVAQATLVIKPFNALQVELNPKRGAATYFSRLLDFDVTVVNLGNAEETLELYAGDPEDGCAYEYDVDRITLKPGQSEVVPLVVRPKAVPILGGVRLYGFTTTVRSVAESIVSASAHGQTETRPLISPLLGIFLLLLILVGYGAWQFRPRPLPALLIQAFDASEKRIPAGQEVTLTWEVAPADADIIIYKRVRQNGVDVVDPGPQKNPVGSLRVRPEPPLTIYTIKVTSHGRKREQKVAIEVTPPPAPPKPTIKFLRADPPVIHQGENLILAWEAAGVKDFILDPGNIPISRFERTRQVTPAQDMEYTLRAIGLDEKYDPASKKVTVRVVSPDTCVAEIVRFVAQPADVYIGETVRLKWQTRYARSVKIDTERGPLGDVNPGSSSKDVTILEPTTFTLTAADSLGKTVTKTITVTPKPRPVVPETDSGEPGNPNTTGGGNPPP